MHLYMQPAMAMSAQKLLTLFCCLCGFTLPVLAQEGQRDALAKALEAASVACAGGIAETERKTLDAAVAKFIRGAEGKGAFEKRRFENYVFGEAVKAGTPGAENIYKHYTSCIADIVARVVGRKEGTGQAGGRVASLDITLEYCERRRGSATCILALKSDKTGPNVWVSGKTALVSNSGETFGARNFRLGSDKVAFSDTNAWRALMLSRGIMKNIDYALQIDFPDVTETSEIRALSLYVAEGAFNQRPLDVRPLIWK